MPEMCNTSHMHQAKINEVPCGWAGNAGMKCVEWVGFYIAPDAEDSLCVFLCMNSLSFSI